MRICIGGKKTGQPWLGAWLARRYFGVRVGPWMFQVKSVAEELFSQRRQRRLRLAGVSIWAGRR